MGFKTAFCIDCTGVGETSMWQDDVVTLWMGLMVVTAFGDKNGAGKGNVGYQQLSQGSS